MSKVEMKTSEAQEITRRAIGLAIVKHKDKIIALLKKYGIAMDGRSDDDLIVAIMIGIRDNARFRKDLQGVLANTTKETVGFTAEYNTFFFTGGPDFFNAIGDMPSSAYSWEAPATATPATKSKSAVGQLLSDPKLLGSILDKGLDTLSNSLTNKSNQKLADTALQIEAEKTKQAALLAAGGGTGSAAGGLSTGAKIGIGLGVVAVVATIIWLVVRKK